MKQIFYSAITSAVVPTIYHAYLNHDYQLLAFSAALVLLSFGLMIKAYCQQKARIAQSKALVAQYVSNKLRINQTSKRAEVLEQKLIKTQKAANSIEKAMQGNRR